MQITMRHFKYGTFLVSFLFLASLSFAQDGKSTNTPVTISEVSKDVDNKTLTMKVEKDGEEVIAEYQDDPNERISPSVLEHFIEEQKRIYAEWIEFVRAYMVDPKNFYVLYLGKTDTDRRNLESSLKTPEQIDDLFQKLSVRQRTLIGLAYKAKTYDPLAAKKFYARYLGLPETTSLKVIDERTSELKRGNPTLFAEMNRIFHINHDGLGYRLYSAVSRPFNTQLHGFPAQSALFAVAIGGVMMFRLYQDYAANPAALMQHIESLDDPIAHLAFYSFMAANGLVGDYLHGKLGGQGMPGSMAKRFGRAAIPYIGMTAGMLTSNLTHEVANLISVCTDKLLGKKPDPMQMMMMQAAGGKQQDPCDVAHAEFFNFENKVEQYIPMIISMSLSTVGSTVAQGMIAKASHKGGAAIVKWSGFGAEKAAAIAAESGEAPKAIQTMNGMSKIKYYGNVSANGLLKVAKAGTRASIGIKGFVMTARIVPLSNVWFNTITVGAVIFSTAQNFVFVYLDTIMIPWLSKQWAQIWRAGGVKKADQELLTILTKYEKSGWTESSRNCGTHNMILSPEQIEPATLESCDYDLEKAVENFQKQMEAWRMQNHARFFTGVQIWNDITTNLINEVSESQKFYNFYINEVFKSRRIMLREAVEKKPVEDVDRFHKQYLPFRATPLYGIRPLGHKACQTGMAEIMKMMGAGDGKDKAGATPEVESSCDTELSLYFNHPDRMIGFQRNQVQRVVNIYGELFGMQKKELPYADKIEVTGIEAFDDKPEVAAQIEAEAKKDFSQQTKELRYPPAPIKDLEKYDESVKQLNLHIRSHLLTGNQIAAKNYVALVWNQDGSFNTDVVNQHLKPESKKFIKEVLVEMETSDVDRIAKAILKMNNELRGSKLRDPIAEVVLTGIRTSLGSPEPILARGAALPYLYHANNKDSQGYKSIERTKGRYKFNSYVEFMIYQMVCGPDSNSNDIISEWSPFGEKYPMLPPKFHAPRISTAQKLEVEWHINVQPKKSPMRTEVCDPYVHPDVQVPFDSLYYSRIYVNGDSEPIPFFNLLNEYIPQQILGDLKTKSGTRDERIDTADITSPRNTSRVSNWWEYSVTNPLKHLFVKLDDRYQGLLVDLYSGLQKDEYEIEIPGTDAMGNPDYSNATKVTARPMKRTKASQSLLQSNIEEMNIYLKILAVIESKQKQRVLNPPKKADVKNAKGKKAAKVKATKKTKEPVIKTAKPGQLKNNVQLNGNADSLIEQLSQDPKSFNTSQDKLLTQIETVIKLLRQVKIVNKEGKQRVVVGDQTGSLKKYQKEAMKALNEYKDHVAKLGIQDPAQVKVAKMTLQGLEKTLQNLTVYLLNIQLANYSMIKSFDDYVKDNKDSRQNSAPVNTSSSRPKSN